MTKLLEQGIEAARELPPDRQDMVGELLLRIAASEPDYQLTPDHVEDVRQALAEAERGEFASEADLRRMWKRFGL